MRLTFFVHDSVLSEPVTEPCGMTGEVAVVSGQGLEDLVIEIRPPVYTTLIVRFARWTEIQI